MMHIRYKPLNTFTPEQFLLIRFALASLCLALGACTSPSSVDQPASGQSGIQVYGTVDIGVSSSSVR